MAWTSLAVTWAMVTGLFVYFTAAARHHAEDKAVRARLTTLLLKAVGMFITMPGVCLLAPTLFASVRATDPALAGLEGPLLLVGALGAVATGLVVVSLVARNKTTEEA